MGECVTNKLVFPALEAFEERLANPTLYYLFYEYFLRAAVGEEEWKLSTGHHKMKRKGQIGSISPTTAPDKRMASSLDEAFALNVFKNNYFAWLMEAKQKHNGLLVTDYDSGRSLTLASPTLVQYLLNGSVVDLEWEEEESYILWKPATSPGGRDPEPNFNSAYAAGLNKFKLGVQRIREKVKNSPYYQHLTDAMKELRTANDVDDRSRKKKKRKLLKDLKPYTGGIRVGDEKAFRGWSGRAFVELLDLKKAIMEEKDTYKRFGRAYRQLYLVQRKDTLASVPVNLQASKDVLDDEQYRQQLFDLEDG